MNGIQTKLSELKMKGWTYASIADELDLTSEAIKKWKAGNRNPANEKAVLTMLEKLALRKRIPKKRRYAKGSRQGKSP